MVKTGIFIYLEPKTVKALDEEKKETRIDRSVIIRDVIEAHVEDYKRRKAAASVGVKA